jgi:hypothetical protein
MTGGAKQTQLDAMYQRVGQDTDATSMTYVDYVDNGLGNGRRLVACPINTGYPNYEILSIGAFFLLPASEYSRGGGEPFCAEYVGPYVQGATHKGGGSAGGFVARLVQ